MAIVNDIRIAMLEHDDVNREEAQPADEQQRGSGENDHEPDGNDEDEGHRNGRMVADSHSGRAYASVRLETKSPFPDRLN
jgi:hypothetical protein